MKVEKLKCASCGRTFQREVKRGRKPARCPKCQGASNKVARKS